MTLHGPNDQLIICTDCGDSFWFTERDQEFYKEHSYNPPKRCKPCRAQRKKKTQEAVKYGITR